MKINSYIRTITDFIKICFIDGILTLLPIALTVAIFIWLFRWAKRLAMPIYTWEPTYFHAIPHSEILFTILLIFLIGAIFRTYLIRSFLLFVEALILQIPLVSSIYSGIKQLVNALITPDERSFNRVVAVEFPKAGVYSIGFLTNEAPPGIMPPDITEKHHLVFVPHTPNPTSGFLITVKESEIRPVNLSRQEAMSLIISGGIVKPERFIK